MMRLGRCGWRGVEILTVVGALAAALPLRAQQEPAGPNPVGGPQGSAALTRPVRAEILVVLARAEEGAIAPELANLPALRQPPFDAYRSMTLLSRVERSLSSDAPIEYDLVNGRRLRVELVRVTADGRYRVRISINRPGESDYLPVLQVVASPGDPFFVAGQSWQGGTLVIGLRIGERPATRKAT